MNVNRAVDMMEAAVTLARLTDRSAHTTARTVVALTRLGCEATRNAERLCSDERYSQEKYDRKVDSISRRTFQALADLGIAPTAVKLEINGDPRGVCLKVRLAPRGAESVVSGYEHTLLF